MVVRYCAGEGRVGEFAGKRLCRLGSVLANLQVRDCVSEGIRS